MIDPENTNHEPTGEWLEESLEPESAAALPPIGSGENGRCRILLVDPSPSVHEVFRASVECLHVECDSALNVEECRGFLDAKTYDVLVMDADVSGGSGFDLVLSLRSQGRTTCAVFTSDHPSLEVAIDAMRCGGIDLIAKPLDSEETVSRIADAMRQASRLRNTERRVERLKRICKRLNNAREEATKQVDVLCDDLIGAYDDLAGKMGGGTLAGEFGELIRQELDVEALLRSTLEFLLTKTGPTNAAVFLPTGHDEYNLGAYVNYDIPKETADVLLDQLADIMAGPFAEAEDIVHCTSRHQLASWIGEDAHWLDKSGVVAFPCRHEDEVLAVMALFRDRGSPFGDEMLDQLRVMRDLFAEQLARVVRIHHRHIDQEGWPGFDIETDDDIGGMAA